MEFPKMSADFVGRIKKDNFTKKFRRFALLTAVVFVAVLFTRGDYGLMKIFRLHSKVADAEREITRLKVQAEDIQWEIDKLKADSIYIKLYAAENYGYAQADKAIIQFLPPPEDSLK
jgi:cell division protein FtsB